MTQYARLAVEDGIVHLLTCPTDGRYSSSACGLRPPMGEEWDVYGTSHAELPMCYGCLIEIRRRRWTRQNTN